MFWRPNVMVESSLSDDVRVLNSFENADVIGLNETTGADDCLVSGAGPRFGTGFRGTNRAVGALFSVVLGIHVSVRG